MIKNHSWRKTMKALIVAIDQENGIGKNGCIPWCHPEDMKFFSKTTKNSTCIMGRKTYEDIFEKLRNTDQLLPHRESLVISHQDDFTPQGAKRYKSLEEALQAASNDDVFFTGGSGIYDEAIKLVDTVYITEIPGTHECDVKISEDFLRHLLDHFILTEEVEGKEVVYTKYTRTV